MDDLIQSQFGSVLWSTMYLSFGISEKVVLSIHFLSCSLFTCCSTCSTWHCVSLYSRVGLRMPLWLRLEVRLQRNVGGLISVRSVGGSVWQSVLLMVSDNRKTSKFKESTYILSCREGRVKIISNQLVGQPTSRWRTIADTVTQALSNNKLPGYN